jgi:alpha,alpha-trehalase
VLHALTFQPTGAIVAAPTTSLPEWAGGQRNWDYRYAWIRDASRTMEALWVAACPHEAAEFFDFMATATAFYDPNDTLQVMFGVGGEHDLHERQLPHLQGWQNSRPVRVGNAAYTQVQLDGHGALLGAVHRYRNMLTGIDPHVRRLLVCLADAAARRWREPDQGHLGNPR